MIEDLQNKQNHIEIEEMPVIRADRHCETQTSMEDKVLTLLDEINKE